MQRAPTKLRAFTLIEMLVVVAVIGILAGILLGVLPAAQRKGIRGRVKTELAAVETAINSYKAKNNFYPPGNFRDGFPNTLFYELTGTIQEPDNGPLKYRSKFVHDDVLTEAQLQQVFQMKGFLNAAPQAEEGDIRNFYPTLVPRQIREMQSNGVSFKVLAAARQGMDGQPAVWQYRSGVNATNNPGEFDLWAEIEVAGQKIVIGNWEK